jgi:OOP family OmpA-OmpF porin
MLYRRLLAAAIAACAIGIVAPSSAQAQFRGLKDRLKKKAEEKVTQQIEKKAEAGTDKAIAGAEKVITCLVTDRECIRAAKERGNGVIVTDAAGARVSTADSARAIEQATGGASLASGAASAAPRERIGEGAWANYDFVPGDRALFVEDFTSDNVGDFPRRLTFRGGNMEVVEWKGGRYLRATETGEFAIPLPEVLPQRFTMELDVFQGARRNSWGAMELRFGDERSQAYVTVNWTDGGIQTPEIRAVTPLGQEKFADAFVPLRIMADGEHVKIYMGDTRVANVPNAKLGRARQIWVKLPASAESPAFIGGIRIAAGGRKLYDAIAANGRVATQGIYFASASAEIEPQSQPTLKEIVTMLQEHPDLALEVEGHTDNVGNAEANQALSEQRAKAVVAYLATNGIDASRLSASGYGATRPTAPNTTAEGRAANRRVELVRRGK